MENEFDIQEYLAEGVEGIVKDAIHATFTNPKESIFLLKFSKHAKKATKIRQKYKQKDYNIPVFLIASITSRCNLHCTGCYSRANNSCSDDEPQNQLTGDEWENVFKQARELGISFIVLAGGEPLLRGDVIKKASLFPEILYPIFTNGTIINKDYIKLFDKHRNLVPVLSIEGDEKITDLRRGEGVYTKLMSSIEMMRKRGLIFGASLTFTRKNSDSLIQDEYINKLHELGCRVIFFIEYVPIDETTVDLAPGEEERERLLDKINQLRKEYDDMLFMSFPGDEKVSGGCLAAGRGFFHINSNGGAEPCPASPYSDINVKQASLLEVLDSKLFKSLRSGDLLLDDHDGGCVLFEHRDEVERLLYD